MSKKKTYIKLNKNVVKRRIFIPCLKKKIIIILIYFSINYNYNQKNYLKFKIKKIFFVEILTVYNYAINLNLL